MYSKIWVTGGTGLVGRALRETVVENGRQEWSFTGSKDCDLTSSREVQDKVKEFRPDAIIHLAAKSGGIGYSTKCPATLLRDNLLMNLNVLDAAKDYGVKKVILTLSTGMYPDKVSYPIKEEYIHDGPPHDSNYSYSFAKRLAEPMIRAYQTEYGLCAIGLVPNGIIGEYMNYRPDESTVVGALIRRFYENRNDNTPIYVWGDGSPLREFTYAKDLARAYLWCLDNYSNPQILHIGTTEEHSIKEIAYMTAEELGIDLNRIEFDISKPAGQFRKNTDNSKFTALSNFKYTTFGEALKNTIDYFKNNFQNGSLRL